MARQWTNLMKHEHTIHELRRAGKTNREVAMAFGVELRQIEQFIARHNKRQRAGITEPRKRGRPRKTVQTQDDRIQELEREVALLRSFLLAAGRM